MKCSKCCSMIGDFIGDKLSDDDLEDFLEHIEDCRDCYDELEVYYVITKGVERLDEQSTGSLNFKKNLTQLIASKHAYLKTREKQEKKKELYKAAVSVLLLLVIMGSLEIYNGNRENIHGSVDFFSYVEETFLQVFGIETASEDVAVTIEETETMEEETEETEKDQKSNDKESKKTVSETAAGDKK